VVDQLVGEYEWTLARLAERGLWCGSGGETGYRSIGEAKA